MHMEKPHRKYISLALVLCLFTMLFTFGSGAARGPYGRRFIDSYAPTISCCEDTAVSYDGDIQQFSIIHDTPCSVSFSGYGDGKAHTRPILHHPLGHDFLTDTLMFIHNQDGIK